jgi:hypothetical protein
MEYKMKTIIAQSLGNSTAEHDHNLKNYYVPNDYLNSTLNFSDKKTFFIGRKGVGKSAIVEHIRQVKDPNEVITINPDDFSFNLLEESQVIKDLTSINPEVIYKYLWKYLVIIEILKHTFGAKKPFIPFTSANKVHRFLMECGEISQLDLTMGERLVKMIERIKISAKSLNVSAEVKISATDKTSTIEIFKQIDNLVKELPQLLKHKKYYILIDDLDNGWQNSLIQNQFLKALFKALFKFISMDNFRFIICLREDIFSQLKLEDSDKFQDYIVEMSWNECFLKEVIEKRISFAYDIPQEKVWDTFFVPKISHMTPFNYIFQRTLCRPRDIIQFVQACIERAARQKHKLITDGDIREAERSYSKRKLGDLANEYKYVYPNLDNVLALFAGKPRELDYKQLEEIILTILGTSERQNIDDPTSFKWILNQYYNEPDELIRMLIDIDFLGYRTTQREPVCFGYEKKPIIISPKFRYRVHECFVNALDLR